MHFDVYSPGQVTATAAWDGPPGVLAITITGPGPSPPEPDGDRVGPLVVRLDLGENDLVSGSDLPRADPGGDAKERVVGKLRSAVP